MTTRPGIHRRTAGVLTGRGRLSPYAHVATIALIFLLGLGGPGLPGPAHAAGMGELNLERSPVGTA